jgi:hypothetical protein
MPREIDAYTPCPFDLTENPKDRRLRFLKVRIAHKIKWTKISDKIHTLEALQNFSSTQNILKLANEMSDKNWSFDEQFLKNQKQIWILCQTNLVIKARNLNTSFEINQEAGDAELRPSNIDHIDESISIESIITIFHFLKDN